MQKGEYQPGFPEKVGPQSCLDRLAIREAERERENFPATEVEEQGSG